MQPYNSCVGGWTKYSLDEEIDLPASYTFSIQADQDQSHSTHDMPSVIQSVSQDTDYNRENCWKRHRTLNFSNTRMSNRGRCKYHVLRVIPVSTVS